MNCHRLGLVESIRPQTVSQPKTPRALGRSRRSGVRFPASVAVLVAIGVLSCPTGRSAANASESPYLMVDGDLGPISDLLGDILDAGERAKRVLDDAADLVFGGMQGAGPNPSALAHYLDVADATIAGILDPTSEPSLTPTDAGEVDENVNPVTLGEYAMHCCVLALDAVHAIRRGDYEQAGTCIRTIQALLPQYRALAGL